MEMQDRSPFEDEWEKAFAEAKSTPSEKVWNKLELHLAESTSGMYKRRLIFFKLLAAASIFLAFSVGGIAVYLEYFHIHSTDQISLADDTKSDSNQINGDQTESDAERASSEKRALNSAKEGEATISLKTEDRFDISVDRNTSSLPQDNPGQQETALVASEKIDYDALADSQKDETGLNSLIGDEKDDKRSSMIAEGVSESPTLSNKVNSPEIDSDISKTDFMNPRAGIVSVDDKKDKLNNSIKVDSQVDANGDDTMTVATNSLPSDHSIQNASQADKDVNIENFERNELSLPFEQGETSKGFALASSDEVPEELEGLYQPLLVQNEISEPSLSMVPWYAKAYEKKVDYKRLWAGVGVSRGSFDPNGLGMEDNGDFANAVEDFEPSLQRSIAPQRVSSPSISDETQGSSLNLGVNFGARLSRRWIVQSGVNYLEQNTSSSSNLVTVENANSDPLTELTDEFSLTSNEVVFIDEYGISNSYRSISIPVQAGYILLDRKFNITLLGGISNDFLVAKSVTDDTGVLETVVIDQEEVSNLNSYNISAIVGSEFGYNLGEYYSISINPQFRRSFSAFNQGNGSGESFPIGIEIGFRFKYLLK